METNSKHAYLPYDWGYKKIFLSLKFIVIISACLSFILKIDIEEEKNHRNIAFFRYSIEQ